jgi:hypothetical protein
MLIKTSLGDFFYFCSLSVCLFVSLSRISFSLPLLLDELKSYCVSICCKNKRCKWNASAYPRNILSHLASSDRLKCLVSNKQSNLLGVCSYPLYKLVHWVHFFRKEKNAIAYIVIHFVTGDFIVQLISLINLWLASLFIIGWLEHPCLVG